MVELSESMGVQKVNIERPFPIFVLMSLHTKKKETEQKKKTIFFGWSYTPPFQYLR